MPKSKSASISETSILRRVVDPDRPFLSEDAAHAILGLSIDKSDRARMNRLAEKNRKAGLVPTEEEELNNFIRVGQTLGILQFKARRSLKSSRSSRG